MRQLHEPSITAWITADAALLYVIVSQGTRIAGTRSLHVVVAKAYTVGKALHLAVLLISMLKNSLLAALVTLRWP